MTILRVIGDLHGDYSVYHNLVNRSCDYSVQLGDFGFDYSILQNLDSDCHSIVLGNHSNYDIAFTYPHILGNFRNVYQGPFEFFFVRGAFSIDKEPRLSYERNTGHKVWWKEEELTQLEGNMALNHYEKYKPKVMMTHEAPNDLCKMMSNKDMLRMFDIDENYESSTQILLQQMLEIHSPKLWLFGHWHRHRMLIYKSTTFICVGEKEYIDFDENWNIVGGSHLTKLAEQVQ